VREAWLGVFRGIDRFEGRSSLKTWIFRIVTNVAKTRTEREARTVPFSALERELEADEPAVEPERFRPRDAPLCPGGWADPREAWGKLEAAEVRDLIGAAIERLPEAQRTMVSLRDIEGWSSEEVRNALQISETNQRVLLHRARSKVRAALERYLAAD
jgi:RNA polymerase sigma-70 factor, ECF subfamily